MLRDGRQIPADKISQFSDRAFPAAQPVYDHQPGFVGKSLEHLGLFRKCLVFVHGKQSFLIGQVAIYEEGITVMTVTVLFGCISIAA